MIFGVFFRVQWALNSSWGISKLLSTIPDLSPVLVPKNSPSSSYFFFTLFHREKTQQSKQNNTLKQLSDDTQITMKYTKTIGTIKRTLNEIK